MSTDALESEIIDISTLKTLEEQKECCNTMLEHIKIEEIRISNGIKCVQTINDVMHNDNELAISLGEFIGYHFGRMNTSKNMFDNAISNLNDFVAGNYDDLEHGSRGMFISVWHTVGVHSLYDIDDCLSELEDMEVELMQMSSVSEKSAMLHETMH